MHLKLIEIIQIKYESVPNQSTFPDLPGCISDAETPEEAIINGKDAVAAWIAAMQESGREIPKPGEAPSGKFIARVPRSIHARLSARAKQEGVSMNALVSSFLAESLGRCESVNDEAQKDTSADTAKRRNSALSLDPIERAGKGKRTINPMVTLKLSSNTRASR